MDNHPISSFNLGHYFQVDGKQLQQQYKHHISDFNTWDQKEHASERMLFEQNVSPFLSIDETAQVSPFLSDWVIYLSHMYLCT